MESPLERYSVWDGVLGWFQGWAESGRLGWSKGIGVVFWA